MVFLRSYLHDATFETSDVLLRGTALRIRLKRDRWELYKSQGELESVATRLIIRPVLSLKWQSKAKLANKFSICDVYLGESFWNNSVQPRLSFPALARSHPSYELLSVTPSQFVCRMRLVGCDREQNGQGL